METLTASPTSTVTILACQKIAKAFKENIYELSHIRKDWNPGYATLMNESINDTIDKYYLGAMDSIDISRFREWHEFMIAGMTWLKVLRASIKVDFKEDKKFLKDFFEKHGYTEFFSDAKNGDHRSLCKFLTVFAQNLDTDTKKRIEAKNTDERVIANILQCARNIKNFSHCFEALESEQDLNSHGQREVGEIYTTIEDICRIAMAYYQFDPVKRDDFNFYKTLVNL